MPKTASDPASSPAPAPALSHLNDKGEARMVEVGQKPETARAARASGTVVLQAGTLRRILAGEIKKGEVLQVARIAAIQAVKRTADLIPLCHPLRITGVDVTFRAADQAADQAADDSTPRTLQITAEVRAFDRTGVEMEALTAVTVAALTVYDMCKAVDRGMRITDVCLDEKSGGRSGLWTRDG